MAKTPAPDRMTIQERYMRATVTSKLRLDANAITDADVLLAAGYAATNHPDKMLALDFYRLGARGDMRGLNDLARIAGHWITGRTCRRKYKGLKITGIAARDLAKKVIMWWARPACRSCEGRGHPRIKDAPTVDESRDCEHCRGTGTEPLEKLVKLGEAEEARWLAAEIERLTSEVFGDMLKLMRPDMLDVKTEPPE